MITITVFLFDKPALEVDIEGNTIISGELFRELGDELRGRLHIIAEITDKLLKLGWECSGGLYDIHFYKDTKLKEAKKELKTFEKDLRELLEVEEEW